MLTFPMPIDWSKRKPAELPVVPDVTDKYRAILDLSVKKEVVVKEFKPEYFVLSATGAPLEATLEEWGAFLEGDRKIVKVTEKGGIKVSTVFLGLAHGYDDGVPILWETQVFGGRHGGEHIRSATHPGALVNHHNMVLKVFSGY